MIDPVIYKIKVQVIGLVYTLQKSPKSRFWIATKYAGEEDCSVLVLGNESSTNKSLKGVIHNLEPEIIEMNKEQRI